MLEIPTRRDHASFEALVAPFRRELHAHCYRMLGSRHDADDALQDTLLRAWRGIDSFEGRSSVRSWLHTIATNACLDAIRARGRRALPMDLRAPSGRAVIDDAPAEGVAWLTPYPAGAGPEAHAEQSEAVELAFVAAVQHLPGNQRAAVLLFDVLGYSASEIATMLATSTAAVNSALQRARRTLADRVPATTQARELDRLGDEGAAMLVAKYCAALEGRDVDGLLSLLTADATWSMPPLPNWYRGLVAVRDFVERLPLGSCGTWRHRPTRANGQPAVASYLAPLEGDPFSAWSINVFTLRDGRIAEITSFIGPDHFASFGLPAVFA